MRVCMSCNGWGQTLQSRPSWYSFSLSGMRVKSYRNQASSLVLVKLLSCFLAQVYTIGCWQNQWQRTPDFLPSIKMVSLAGLQYSWIFAPQDEVQSAYFAYMPFSRGRVLTDADFFLLWSLPNATCIDLDASGQSVVGMPSKYRWTWLWTRSMACRDVYFRVVRATLLVFFPDTRHARDRRKKVLCRWHIMVLLFRK